MVRIVGSHHFAHSGQIVPVMYPHLKKHHRDLRAPVSLGSRGHQPSSQRPDDNTMTSEMACNIPNLDILSPGVIDVHAAETAVRALRVEERPSGTGGWRSESPRGVEGDVEMCEETDRPEPHPHTYYEGRRLDSVEDLESRLTGDVTESDSTETHATDDGGARKARRRQRNKLSARAYRDRKRSKAQEQEQVLASLEAEQGYLLESVRKLQEEKRRFLQFLKSEMNIDMTKTESDDVSMNMAET